MKKSQLVILQTAIVAAAFLMGGCKEKSQADASKATMAPPVMVATPLKRPVEVWDAFTAKLKGEKSVEVRARVSGYLEKILFKDGEYVKAGQTLFIIDPRPFEAVVKECQARVKECEARITLAQSNLKRAEALIKTNAISGEVLETRKCELLSANASLLSAEAKLKEASLNLEFTTIVSPISGFVSRRYVDEGNLVSAAQTLLATVVSRDTIYAYFFVSERDIIRYNKNGLFSRIDKVKHTGPEVKMMLLDEDEATHKGTLTYMENSLETGSVELRAEFDNKDLTLFPGIMGKIYLKSDVSQEKLLVPESAVGTDLVGRYVLVVDEKNTIKYVPVRVGRIYDGMQVVESGLKGDELIVVNGLQRAIPGRQVTPVKQNAQKQDKAPDAKSASSATPAQK